MPNDTLWTGGTLDDLRSEFGDTYEGRTVLVTGADGFMGSHLTDASSSSAPAFTPSCGRTRAVP